MIRGLLLDFYGTVVEEDDALIATAAQEIAVAADRAATPTEVSRVWGRHFADGCARAHGPGFRSQRSIELAAIAETVARFGAAAIDVDTIADRLFEQWTRPAILPDAARFLDRLDLPVVVVSNIDRPDLEAAIAHGGLAGRFDAVVASSDVRAYKPRPEPFAAGVAALRRLGRRRGVSIERPGVEVLHVGDSRTADVDGANRYGLPVAYVDRRGRPVADGSDVVASVTQLDDLGF